MSRPNRTTHEHFGALRKRARDEVNRGNWHAALALFDEAVAWAETYGDKEDQDLAYCNRAGILIAQGNGKGAISKLRQILLSSASPEICYHAAYNISRFHEMRKEGERGLFYARVCLDHAKKAKDTAPMARAHNQIGHLLVQDSYFTEARESYEQALGLLRGAPSHDSAIIMANIGYCHVVAESYDQGFRELFRSLRLTRRLRAGAWEMLPRLVLAYAYLDIERPHRARVHARRGLILAEDAEITWQIKNALYLLGESEKLCGNELAAHRNFDRLQRDFYPDDPVVCDVLMTTDVRKLINLMA